MGITEILRRIWLFSANKIKSFEFVSKQPTQLIIATHNCHKYGSQCVEAEEFQILKKKREKEQKLGEQNSIFFLCIDPCEKCI